MPDTLTRMAATYPEVRIEMTQREPETALQKRGPGTSTLSSPSSIRAMPLPAIRNWTGSG